MSLLEGGALYEPCTVYLETTKVDEDGNTLVCAATDGVSAVARFQPQSSSGTSASFAELSDGGFGGETFYLVRFPRSFTDAHGVLGAASQVEWQGKRWSIYGEASLYNSSPKTKHVTYVIKAA